MLRRHAVGKDILKKAFTCASVLDILESGSFKIIVRTDAMVDAHGYVIGIRWLRCDPVRGLALGLSYACIFAWALHIARLTMMGTCQSLKMWDEQLFGTHAFCFLIVPSGVSAGHISDQSHTSLCRPIFFLQLDLKTICAGACCLRVPTAPCRASALSVRQA